KYSVTARERMRQSNPIILSKHCNVACVIRAQAEAYTTCHRDLVALASACGSFFQHPAKSRQLRDLKRFAVVTREHLVGFRVVLARIAICVEVQRTAELVRDVR